MRKRSHSLLRANLRNIAGRQQKFSHLSTRLSVKHSQTNKVLTKVSRNNSSSHTKRNVNNHLESANEQKVYSRSNTPSIKFKIQ